MSPAQQSLQCFGTSPNGSFSTRHESVHLNGMPAGIADRVVHARFAEVRGRRVIELAVDAVSLGVTDETTSGVGGVTTVSSVVGGCLGQAPTLPERSSQT